MTDVTEVPEVPAAEAPERVPQKRNSYTLDQVPIGPVLALQKHMGFTQVALAKALGVNDKTMSGYIVSGSCPRTVALAAECLQRRLGREGRPRHAILTIGAGADYETIAKVVASLGGTITPIEEYGS